AASDKRAALTPVERSAFSEIAAALAKGEAPVAPEQQPAEESVAADAPPKPEPPPEAREPMPSAFATSGGNGAAEKTAEAAQLAILERLPVGILIHRADALLYANRAFLEWTGYADLGAVAAAGGLERLVADPGAGSLDRANGTGKTFTIETRTGDPPPCEGRL